MGKNIKVEAVIKALMLGGKVGVKINHYTKYQGYGCKGCKNHYHKGVNYCGNCGKRLDNYKYKKEDYAEEFILYKKGKKLVFKSKVDGWEKDCKMTLDILTRDTTEIEILDKGTRDATKEEVQYLKTIKRLDKGQSIQSTVITLDEVTKQLYKKYYGCGNCKEERTGNYCYECGKKLKNVKYQYGAKKVLVKTKTESKIMRDEKSGKLVMAYKLDGLDTYSKVFRCKETIEDVVNQRLGAYVRNKYDKIKGR